MSASILQVFPVVSPIYLENSPHSIHEIIRKQWDEVKESIPVEDSSGCLLTDIGNFLIHTSTLMSRLAEGLVHGQHVHANTKKAIQEMDSEHDLSKLDPLDYLNEKHALLRLFSAS
jgi:hypothetical protein